jgi:hypothetical protein
LSNNNLKLLFLQIQFINHNYVNPMKKTTILCLMLFALSCFNVLHAQVNIGGNPVSFNEEKSYLLESLTFDQMPPLDMATIEAEDEQWEAERAAGMIKIGRRFGIEFEVDYDLDNSGSWTTLSDGGKLWLLGIECFGALSINLIFDQYHLPQGATLYIFGADKHDKIGGFTNYNNQEDHFFATDIVLSDKIIIEYYQPANADFDGELRLATIVHGYRGSSVFPKQFGQSGACQRNTICPEGNGWEDQVRSVFALYSGGTELCSGSMLNNTANDGTPYALTANHCWQAYQNPGIWVFRFNWESPTCTPTANATYQTMSGATARVRTASSTSATDCCLVELNQPIPEDYNVYFAGWSRSTTNPDFGMCIHHPALDIKKISKAPTVYPQTQVVIGWRTEWIPGGACTEGGSSGSPLFDHNHRVIGQLQGGGSYCGAPTSQMYDRYGRFDVSWDVTNLVSSVYKLKDYLDPLNLNPTTLDGYDPTGTPTTVDAELLNIIVPEATYNSIETITPKVTIKNSGTGAITSATLSYTIDAGTPVTKPWSGSLAIGATTDISFDAITLTYGEHVFEATVTVVGDENPDNNSKTKNYEVLMIDAELLDIIIPGATYSSIETIEPKITVKNSGTGTITSATVSYTIDAETPVTKTWTGTLAAGATTDISFDAITLTYGTHVFEATVTVIGDVDPENDSKTKNYEVLTPECLPAQNITFELSETEITIHWEAPENTDDITGYIVFVNETAMTTVLNTYFILTDIEAINYNICVVALYSYEWCEESEPECILLPLSIGERTNDPIKIYPNPASGEIVVTSYELQVTSIEIYDVYGRNVLTHTAYRLPQTAINVSHLAVGNYLVTVSMENGQKVTKQITINR